MEVYGSEINGDVRDWFGRVLQSLQFQLLSPKRSVLKLAWDERTLFVAHEYGVHVHSLDAFCADVAVGVHEHALDVA